MKLPSNARTLCAAIIKVPENVKVHTFKSTTAYSFIIFFYTISFFGSIISVP